MRDYITFAKPDNRVLPYEKAHWETAYRAATEGIVLLENNGTLPISPGKIALYGAGAEMTIKGGSGSGEVNERHSISILEGLETAGFQITTRKWLDDYQNAYEEEHRKLEKEIKDELKTNLAAYTSLFLKICRYPYGRLINKTDVENSDTDTCIYVVARQSGEGCDRSLEEDDFTLAPVEKENLRFCTSHYRRTIVVLNTGASFDTSFMEEIPGIDALVYLCQLGTAGGTAFANILTGEETPSGRLTDTWVKSYDDIPYGSDYSYLNGNLEEEDYLEDIYVGYRYYDTFHVTPRYPFGYGLSYTDFEISYQSMTRDKEQISVHIRVKNLGTAYSGKEVVQLYASMPEGKLNKEYQRLVAFAKTKNLSPGAETTVTLSFPLSYLASYDEEEAAWILEAGTYLLRFGNHSASTAVCAAIELPQTIICSRHQNVCTPSGELPVLKPKTDGDSSGTAPDISSDIASDTSSNTASEAELQNIQRIQILPEEITETVYEYKPLPVCKDDDLKTQLRSLTVLDRIDLVTGAGMMDMLMNSSYVNVPGVAGNTTSKLLKKGIVNIALADGPAGLRLQRRSAFSRNGTARMIDMQFESMNYYPEFVKKIFCGNPAKEKVYYQYTTAFPVETALAQTWNTELLREVGQAVGEEMEEYGVTFWLAPALNIHRNPLCGRNYEYYSEDPILSGKMAAAITEGVQSIPGRFVTLKHFCANNQEENREHVSSNMTERALREIYLRGFEIAVREGHARGLMTSYNKVNGIYTSNSYDLITKVLRQEWGFDGLVMTDWTATAKGKSDPALCMAAGNDLLMPGSSYDRKCIRQALRDGTLKKRDLNRCAGHVLTAINASCTARH